MCLKLAKALQNHDPHTHKQILIYRYLDQQHFRAASRPPLPDCMLVDRAQAALPCGLYAHPSVRAAAAAAAASESNEGCDGAGNSSDGIWHAGGSPTPLTMGAGFASGDQARLRVELVEVRPDLANPRQGALEDGSRHSCSVGGCQGKGGGGKNKRNSGTAGLEEILCQVVL